MKMNETTMKIDKPTRLTLKHIVRKDQTYSQVVRERIKCDAAGCDAPGINEIKVNAGKFGTVTLFVCPNCVGKFTDDGAGGNAPVTTSDTKDRSQGSLYHATQDR